MKAATDFQTVPTREPETLVFRGETRFGLGEVHAIVLAGVHSWGDCLLDEVVCRPAIPIAARPLICHSLLWLREQGVRTASLCANSDTGYLRRCLGDGMQMGLSLEYYEDVTPRGPAGSLRDAAVVSNARLFVVVYGTVVPQFNLADLLSAHESAGADATLLSTRNKDGSLQPAGVYVFDREALDHIPAKGYQDIKENLLAALHSKGRRVLTHVVDDHVIGRVTDTASYMSVCRWTVERFVRENATEIGYAQNGHARVHETALVNPTVRLIGPVIIEPRCIIENEAVIIGPTTIGEGSRIASRAVVSRSIIWSHCRIGEGAIIDDSILTHHVIVESGLVVRSTVCIPSSAQRSALPARSRPHSVPTQDNPAAVGSGDNNDHRSHRVQSTAAASMAPSSAGPKRWSASQSLIGGGKHG